MMALLFVAAALLLVWGAQRWLARHSLDGIEGDMTLDRAVVEPEEEFTLRILLRNTGRRPVPFVRVKLYFPYGIFPRDPAHTIRDIERRGNTVTYSAWLRPRQEVEFQLPVSIPKRGRYVLQHLMLYGGDFLGVDQHSREAGRFLEVIVPPKEAPDVTLRGRMGGVNGNHTVNRFLYEDAMLTAGCRPYTGQEPMKNILWKQSARGLGLMVKKFETTTEPKLTVLLNVDTGSAGEEELERCLSLTRTVCRILEEKAVTYELHTNARYDLLSSAIVMGTQRAREALEVRQGLGEAHFRRVLENLGRATGETTLSVAAFLEKAMGEGEVHSRILITSRSAMPEAAQLARLRAACGGKLQIFTPEEESYQ